MAAPSTPLLNTACAQSPVRVKDFCVGDCACGLQVGKRKRAMRWNQETERQAREASGRDYYLVPPSRALVPITVEDESQHYM